MNIVPSAHESIAKNPIIGIGVTFEAEPTLASIFSVGDVYDIVFGEDFHPVAAYKKFEFWQVFVAVGARESMQPVRIRIDRLGLLDLVNDHVDNVIHLFRWSVDATGTGVGDSVSNSTLDAVLVSLTISDLIESKA